MSRRAFFRSVWKYLGIVAVLEAIVVSFSLLRTRSSGAGREQRNLKAVGKVSDIPPGTMIPFRTGRFFLVRLEDGGLMAISMICSHLGCTVNWDAAEQVFKCPCHSSSFDRYGDVIKSPASKALNYHKVLIKEDKILVDLENIMVKQKFDPTVITYA